MQYKHNGIEIDLNQSTGKFSAEVDGVIVIKGSLDAMRKHIDKVQKENFPQFSAILRDRFSDKPTRVKVINIKENKSGWNKGTKEFVIDGGGATYPTLFVDSPENTKLMAELDAHEKQANAINEVNREKSRQLRVKLETITPADFREKLKS